MEFQFFLNLFKMPKLRTAVGSMVRGSIALVLCTTWLVTKGAHKISVAALGGKIPSLRTLGFPNSSLCVIIAVV